MPFSEKLANVVDKFLDNANVGKFVTDVGPGFALSVSLLMLIGLAGNISVVPADRSALLVRRTYGPEAAAIDTKGRFGPDEEYAPRPLAIPVKCVPESAGDGKASLVPLHATAELHREIEALCVVLKEAAAKGIGVSDPGQNLTQDAVYRFARRTVADLGARIESLDSRRSNRLKQATPTPDSAADLEKIGLEKSQLSPVYERIVAQKEAADEAAERLKTLQNELTDSRSFAKNIQAFTDNSGTLLAFAIILGVLLSQISRLVFVNLMYDRWLPPAEQTSQAEGLKADEETARQAGELVTDYYRYVEGSINMVLPTFLFGLAFCFFVRERFAGHGTWLPPTAVVACTVLAVGLIFAGYYTYRDYRKKMTRLVSGVPPQAGAAPERAAA